MKKATLLLLIFTLLFAPMCKAEINPDWHPCGVYCARTHGPMKPKPEEKKEISLLELFIIVAF